MIDSITVWGAQYDPLSLDIDNITLYLGQAGGVLSAVSTGSLLANSNTNSNPNITHQYVSYADSGSTNYYEGNGSVQYPLCQTTFSGLNYAVQGGVEYYFGVLGRQISVVESRFKRSFEWIAATRL